MDWKATYKSLFRRSLAAIIILAVASLLLLDRTFTQGILLGGVIALGNFDVMQAVISRVFSNKQTAKIKKVGLAITFYLRFIGIAVVSYMLLKRGWVQPVGLIIGLSTVVMGIVSYGLSQLVKNRTEEAT